ncbi:MAG: hypothetical protein WAU00_19955 [Caldilinea sp.]|mgnify:CR=1 FL=1|uniref:hypothetical protein n=1 Tax=Caldilinea sp. TaxID=2293560 RepID=UPI002CC0C55B|nr:hypothetical protein [Anaerolineales bacterium]HQY91132.1 hypothetical protein [Caldilinea sp.]HRA68375.1 hypothetical protein [Caldilinea sp.]
MIAHPRTPRVGIGSIYVSGIWLAQVQYTLKNDSAYTLAGALHILDGERDLFVPPIPADSFTLELADGRQCSFVPATGNPVSGAYTFSSPMLPM